MNNSYKLVYSEALNTWVAVAEHVSARGKKSAVRLVTAAALLAGGAVGTGWALAAPPLITPPAVNQLPTGGQVAAGTVNISQTQTATAASMLVQQSSNRAIVNWQSFNVGANAKVNIAQPSSSSVLLNRVLDTNPSQIFGQINANGQVFLTNPNGVYFAPGSSVDVGSFTASTHSITDSDFLAGKYNFNRNGATGSILNEGNISASLGGYIALLAPEVRNQGVVVAQVGGTVAMAAGESYQLQFNSNNQLTNVLVEPSTLNTFIDNGNAVQAPGGLIILSAQAASSLLGGVVKNSGSISATALTNDGGTIRLSASNKIELTPTSSISADAAPNSSGNGGRIDIITDLNNATGNTQVDGTISAKGGEQGGDGGFVDTSAARLAIGESTLVTTGASKGKAGTWLLDPYDVTIEGPSGSASGTTYASSFTAGATSTILASSITSSLNAGSNVSISTGSATENTIFVNSAINATSGTATLTLTGGTINLAANITTIGSQTYNGAVVINKASGITLASTNSNVNFASTVNSYTGTNYALTINNGTGATSFTGAVGAIQNIGVLTLNGTGTITLGGNVTTTGNQSYGGAVNAADGIAITANATLGPTTIVTNGNNNNSYYALGVTGLDSSSVLGAPYYVVQSGSSSESISSTSNYNVGIMFYNNTGTLNGAGSSNAWCCYNYPILVNAGQSSVLNSISVVTRGDQQANRVPTAVSVYGSNTPFTSANTVTQFPSSTLNSSNLSVLGSGYQQSNFSLIGSGSLSFAGGGAGTTPTPSNTIALSNSNTYQYYLLAFTSPDGSLNSAQTGATSSYGRGLALNAINLYGQVHTPSSVTFNGAVTAAGALTVNTGSLSATSIATSGSLTMNNSGAATITGAITNGTASGSVIQTGTGTTTLSGTNTYTGTTTISAGTIKAASAAALGTGAVSIGASGTLDLTFGGTVALGSSLSMSTGAAITNSANTSSLTVAGTSTLAGNINTAGNQTYSGAVSLGDNTNLTTLNTSSVNTNGTITFGSTVDSSTGNYYGLTVSNGTGTTAFGGVVGGTNPLGYLCINAVSCTSTAAGTTSGNGTTTLAGNVTTSGTQTYGGNLTLGANTALTSTANSGNGAVTVAGSVATALSGSGYLYLEGLGYTNGTVTATSSTGVYLFGGNTYTLASGSSASLSIGTLTYNGVTSNQSSYTFVPNSTYSSNFLIVGGGGGGGADANGGGGGGGVVTNAYNGGYALLSQASLTANSSYSVLIGSGGAVGVNGYNSVAFSYTALGGGYGYAASGGSGGGRRGDAPAPSLGLSTQYSSLGYGFGYPGGGAPGAQGWWSSGGGGAGGAGQKAISGAAGAGGAAYQWVDGNYYAGGGGGAGDTAGLGGGTAVVAQKGGGGDGGVNNSSLGYAGTNGTGGGGGGAYCCYYGSGSGDRTSAGGSGVVSFSYNAYGTHALTINSGTAKGSIGGSISNVSSLTINSTSTLSEITGAIGGSTALNKSGAGGALTLSGANTYTGGTTVSAGTLKIGHATALGGSSGGVSVSNGAALDLNGITMTNTNTLTLNGTGISSGGALTNTSSTATTYAGNLVLGSASSIGSAAGDITASGVVSGAFALTKAGTNTLSLTGSNTYTGGTTISSGTLKMGNADALGNSGRGAISVTSGATLDLNGAVMSNVSTLTLNGTGVSNGGALTTTSSSGGAFQGQIILGSDTSVGSSIGNISLTNVISGAYGLTKIGTANISVGGANTYTGTTTVNGGVFLVGHAQALGSTDGGTTVSSGGRLLLSGGVNVGTEAITLNGGSLELQSGTTSLSGTVNLGASSSIRADAGTQLTLSGVVSGTGRLTKTSGGTLLLTGTNTYSGGTTISAGTLQLGAGGTTGIVAGNVTNNATLAFNRSDDMTYEGIISGTGAVTKLAANTLTFSGTNTYTGGTTISAGTLQIGAGSNTGSITGDITNNATLALNRSDAISLSGVISGTGAVTKLGSGTSTLSGNNSYTGATTVSTGTLAISNAAGLGGTAGGTTVASGATLDLQGVSVGAEALSLNGGTLSTSTGTSSLSGTVALGDNSTANVAGTQLSLSGVVSGVGYGLTKTGTGSLVLSGNNNYSGATTVSAGTLAITHASGLGATSSGTTVASGATLDLRGAAVGAEAVTLSGGTLAATTGTSSLSGAVNLTSASTLSGAGALTLSGAITSNANGLALIGTGTKTLSSTSNTLSTIATGSGVGPLSVVNNAALTIGQVTAGGSTYSGINSTDTVYVSTRTGDLTVSQNVVTTSTATSYSTPALKLGAGSLSAAGTPTGGDVLLSGTPTISVGTGGVALIYSGYATTSAARTLFNSFAPRLSYYSINTDSTYVPTSFAAAYFNLFRESPTTLYTLYVPGQTFTYGTPITSLNYCYSTSASSCAPVSAAGIPSTTQAYAFNNLLLNAGTYPGTIAPEPLQVTGYLFAAGNAVNIVVNPKTVTIANVASTSAYDGLSTYTNVANAMTYNVSGLVGSDAVRSITQTPSNSVVAGNVANAGTFAVTPSAAVLSIGRASNYTFNYTSATATVSKANLTVKVKDDAKFVGEADNAGYDGVSYTGFVAGQTASVLSGAVAIARSNASVNAAGAYSSVLSAASSTLSSTNYNITYAPGNYTIIPADQLLIRLADTSTTYGTAPSYTLSSVQYKSSTGGAVVDLTSRAAVNASAFTLSDGAGGNTALTLGPLSSTLSSAGQVAVGSYQVGASSITNTSANYSNTVNIVGSLSVSQKSLTVAAASGLSKIYDGTTNMTSLGLGLTGLVGADAVSASGLGTYANANAGNNKSFDVSGISLSGADAANYKIASNTLSATTGVITAAPLLITANNDSKTYDAAAYTTVNAATAGVRYSGFVNGETSSDLSGTLSYSGTAIGAVNVGNYVIEPTGQTSSNYAITYGNGALSISPADVRVSATNVALTGTVGKVYDGTNVATLTSNNYVTTGWQGSDGATITQTTGTYDNANSGTNKLVNVTLASSDYTATNGTLLSNYNLPTSASGYVGVITPKSVTVSNASRSTTYDGVTSYNTLAAGTTYTVGAMVGSDAVSSISQTPSGFSGGASGTAQAGTYTITPSTAVMGTGSASNYSFSYVGSTHTVNKATLNLAISKTYDGTNSFSNANSYTFTGMVNSEAAPSISAGAATTSSADANSYSSFATNTLALSDGNYTLTGGTVAATITPKPVSVTNTARSTTYDGVTNYNSLASGTAFTVGAMVGSDAVATVTQTSSGYTGSATGTAQAGSFTVTPSAAILGNGSASNYSFSFVPSTHTVDKANLSVSATPSLSGNVYNGNAFIGSYTTTALNGETFTITGQATGINAGTYASALNVSGSALANYNTPVITNANLVISPKPVTVTNTARSTTYDGVTNYNSLASGTAFTVGAMVGSDAVATVTQTPSGFTGSATGNAQAGSFTVTPSAAVLGTGTAGNYSFSYVSSTHTVDKANLSVSATPSLSGNVYNGNAFTGSYTTTALNGETFTITGQATGINAGTYASALNVSGSALANYNTPVITNANLVISPKPVTVTNTARSTTYDGVTNYTSLASGTTFTVGTMVGSDVVATVTQTPSGFSGSSSGAAQAGTFTVTPSSAVLGTGSASNYSFSFVPSTHTVDKANLSVSATPSLSGNVYNGSAFTGTYTTTAVNGETFTVTGQATGINAGTYASALNVSGPALVNYNTPVITDANLVISPKPVTVTNTARSTTYDGVTNYNSLASGTTFTVGTMVGSDAVATVTQTPSGFTGSATGNAQAGSFTVTPSTAVLSTGTASNYSFSFVPSTHTVDKANLSVSATPSLSGNVYNGSAFTGTYTTTAVNGETFTVTGQATGINAGTYASALNVSGPALVNYNTPFITDANLVISPKPVTVANTDRTTTYDGVSTYAALAGGTSFTPSTMVGNDAVGSLTQTPSSNGAANTGTFTVTPSAAALSTGTASNYDFTYVPSTHTVNKAALTLTASTNTKNFDGKTDAQAIPTVSGLKGSDTVSNLVEVYSDVNPGTGKTLTVKAGYQISDGNQGRNYTITLVPDQTGEIRAQAVAVLPPEAPSASNNSYAPPTLTLFAASATVAPASSVSSSSSASSSSNASSNSVSVGSSSGVVVNTINSPTTQVNGLVAVLVPSGTATAGTGLVIALPEQVLTSNAASTSVQVNLPNNEPLPSWIRYDAATQTLVTTAVPTGAFPLSVVVTVDGKSTIIQISESKTNP